MPLSGPRLSDPASQTEELSWLYADAFVCGGRGGLRSSTLEMQFTRMPPWPVPSPPPRPALRNLLRQALLTVQ